MTINHRYIEAHRLRLHIAEAGQDNARLVIFLHGFPESWASWKPYLQALGGEHHVIAPDNRGFGTSDRPPNVADYAMKNVIADIHALASNIGKTPFTLVGHDWGGIAAWHFAIAYPALLEQLIILNAPHPAIFQHEIYRNPEQRAASQYMNRLRDPGCEARILAMGIDTFLMSLFGKHLASGAITSEEKAQQLDTWATPGALTAMLNWYRAADYVIEEQNSPNLTTPVIDVPTTVIWGMQDQILLPCLLDELPNVVKSLTIKRLANAGHGLIHEAPDEIIRLFLQAMNTRV